MTFIGSGICPVATVTLGPYSLQESMFINCVMRCPPGHNDAALPTTTEQASQFKKQKLGRRMWGAAVVPPHDNKENEPP